jgi:hypothetical protein
VNGLSRANRTGENASVGFDGVRFRYQQRRISSEGMRKEMSESAALAWIWVVPQEGFLPRTAVGAGFLFFSGECHLDLLAKFQRFVLQGGTQNGRQKNSL